MHNLKLAQSACIGLTLQRHQLSADGTTASIHPAPDHTDMSLYDLSAAEDVAGKVVLITGSSSVRDGGGDGKAGCQGRCDVALPAAGLYGGD